MLQVMAKAPSKLAAAHAGSAAAGEAAAAQPASERSTTVHEPTALVRQACTGGSPGTVGCSRLCSNVAVSSVVSPAPLQTAGASASVVLGTGHQQAVT